MEGTTSNREPISRLQLRKRMSKSLDMCVRECEATLARAGALLQRFPNPRRLALSPTPLDQTGDGISKLSTLGSPGHPRRDSHLGEIHDLTLERKRPSNHFRFLALPPEIRTEIYESLLEDTPYISSSGATIKTTPVTKRRLATKEDCKSCDSQAERRPIGEPAILKVCFLIRREARPYYYGGRAFHIHCEYFKGLPHAADWLRWLGEDLVRSIELVEITCGSLSGWRLLLLWKAFFKAFYDLGMHPRQLTTHSVTGFSARGHAYLWELEQILELGSRRVLRWDGVWVAIKALIERIREQNPRSLVWLPFDD